MGIKIQLIKSYTYNNNRNKSPVNTSVKINSLFLFVQIIFEIYRFFIQQVSFSLQLITLFWYIEFVKQYFLHENT